MNAVLALTETPHVLHMDSPALLLTRVLSLEPGMFLASAANRDILCVLTDANRERAEVVVNQATRNDPAVFSIIGKLRLHGIPHTVRYAPLSEVAGFYKSAANAENADSNSLQQSRVVDFIREAASLHASDVKFQIVGTLCRIRYKIGGRSHTYHEIPAAEGYLLVRTMVNTMAGQLSDDDTQLDENKSQDAQLSVEFAQQCGLMGSRIGTRPAKQKGLLVVLRLLYGETGSGRLTLDSIGYDPVAHVPYLRDILTLSYGIALFSGVTGSGKSTSLKACVEEQLDLNDQEIDLITVEDPVEYEIHGEGAVQTPLMGEWHEATRNLMRLAPNIMMPGEIRDSESAIAAFDGALTGHFVWSTTHTFDACSIMLRLRRLGVDEDFLTNPALVVGLINQSLVRTLCIHCSIPYHDLPPEYLSERLRERVETFCTPRTVRVMKPAGCDRCGKKGWKGRKVAAEVIRPTAEFMRIFRVDGVNAAKVYWVREEAGLTKLAHAIRHINAGLVDPRHVEQDVGPLNKDRIELGV
jgi:type II secretory ATPase GspE/PulE/Tfp pilus assembly ATPase PilB-like protein